MAPFQKSLPASPLRRPDCGKLSPPDSVGTGRSPSIFAVRTRCPFSHPGARELSVRADSCLYGGIRTR